MNVSVLHLVFEPAGYNEGLFCSQLLALLSLLGAETGVSTAKNASPIKGSDQKSRRSEDQVAFHPA